MTVLANAVAGVIGLLAWQRPGWGRRGLAVATVLAQATILVQVTTGALLESSPRYVVDRIHIFYGFVAFVTVGIVVASRDQIRNNQEMVLGLAGLFLMGVALRAIQVIS
ncbi:MAG: hypothetical protein ACRDZ3_22830 [Acidimicrobiia bacterium]